MNEFRISLRERFRTARDATPIGVPDAGGAIVAAIGGAIAASGSVWVAIVCAVCGAVVTYGFRLGRKAVGVRADQLAAALAGSQEKADQLQAQRDAARAQLEQLRGARPEIRVESVRDGDTFYLRVTNHGGTARFRGEIEPLTRSHQIRLGEHLAACWEQRGGMEAEILNGHSRRLRIGRCRISDGPVPSMTYEVHCADDRDPEGFSRLRSTSWIPTRDDNVERPDVRLRVTISSDPPPRDGAFMASYVMGSSGLVRLRD